MDDNGQMIVFEVIFFAITIFLTLLFIYQMSPSSIVTNTYQDDLKTAGDTALYTLQNDIVIKQPPSNYRFNKLEHYLITNGYTNLVTELNNLLPSTVIYNIYICHVNHTSSKTIFWCSSSGNWSEPMPMNGPVTISHCIVAIDPAFFKDFPDDHYMPGKYDEEPNSDLFYGFPGTQRPVYDFILEMCYI